MRKSVFTIWASVFWLAFAFALGSITFAAANDGSGRGGNHSVAGGADSTPGELYDESQDLVSEPFARRIAEFKCRTFFGEKELFDIQKLWDTDTTICVYVYIYKEPACLITKEELLDSLAIYSERFENAKELIVEGGEENDYSKVLKERKDGYEYLALMNKKECFYSIYVSATKTHTPVIEWRQGLPEPYLYAATCERHIKNQSGHKPDSLRFLYFGPLEVYCQAYCDGEHQKFLSLSTKLNEVSRTDLNEFRFRSKLSELEQKTIEKLNPNLIERLKEREEAIEKAWEYFETTSQQELEKNPDKSPSILTARQLDDVPDFNQWEFKNLFPGAGCCGVMAFADVVGYWDQLGYWNLVDFSWKYNPDGHPNGGFHDDPGMETIDALMVAIADALDYDPDGGTDPLGKGERMEDFTNDLQYGNNLDFHVDEDGVIAPVSYGTLKDRIDEGRPLNITMNHFQWTSGDGPYDEMGGYHAVVVKGYDTNHGGWDEPITVYTNGVYNSYGDIWWDYRDIDGLPPFDVWSWEIEEGGDPGTLLNPPTLVSPLNGSWVTARPTLDWSAVSGANRYRIQLIYEGVWETLMQFETTVSSYSFAGDLPDGFYLWRVVPRNSNDHWCHYSSFFAFWVDAAQPGQPTILCSFPSSSQWSSDRTVGIYWSYPSDGSGSGVRCFSWTWSQSPSTEPDDYCDGTSIYTTSPPLSDADDWYFHIRAKDGVDLWSQVTHHGPYKIDGTAPTSGTISINNGAASTTSLTVTLNNLAAYEPKSGLYQMRFSNNNGVWSSWESYGGTKSNWNLSRYGGNTNPGQKWVYVQYKDAAGNTSSSFSDGINYESPNYPPVLSWTSEADYASDGLHPETGDPTTDYIYRVKYADSDNDPPKSGFPKVHILKGGFGIQGTPQGDSPFSMDQVDAGDVNYTDGKLYAFTQDGLPEGKDYTYYFEAYDDNDHPADGQPCNPVDAPDVISIPFNIDSVQFFLTYDSNGDGKAALGDSVTVVGWGLSNSPFLIDSMIADMSNFGSGFVQLSSAMYENRAFEGKMPLRWPMPLDAPAGHPQTLIRVWAFGDGFLWDTLSAFFNTSVDLDPPVFSGVSYCYRGADDPFVGIGDSIHILADVSGISDACSLWADLFDAGVGGSANQPLYDDGDPTHGDEVPGDRVFSLLWEITEPPIELGKDENNTTPPPIDNQYSVLICVADDAGNWAMQPSGLNATLDTRLPRPVCWNDPDSLQIMLLVDSKAKIYWDRDFDENDAAFFFVYVDSGTGRGYDWDNPMGSTFDAEYSCDFNCWYSDPLTPGTTYRFKIKTEDDCENLGLPSDELVIMSTGVDDQNEGLTEPNRFALFQNYPNPFNPTCNIEYFLPQDCRVTLTIHNTLGRKMKVLVDEYQSRGQKSVRWDGKDDQGTKVTSGVYFYRIQARGFVQSRKMLLLK